MSADKRPVLVIAGPTAAGKTALACRLADTRPLRLISVDSALIYRGMDIGTGKPTPDERRRYPHHLIDIVDASESFSAARFVELTLTEIALAHRQGELPVLVGGTMLYFKALLHGLAELPEADPALRATLEQRLADHGLDALHRQLALVDPAAAERIHRHDPQRILRALEVFMLSGRPMTSFFAETRTAFDYPLLQIAVMPPQRQQLHQRIADRFDAMLQQGFEDEVRALRERSDLHPDLPSIRCVGYRQMWDHLEGKTDFATMRESAIVATRGLAKRQYTWLKNWPVDLVVPDGSEESLRIVLKHLDHVPI